MGELRLARNVSRWRGILASVKPIMRSTRETHENKETSEEANKQTNKQTIKQTNKQTTRPVVCLPACRLWGHGQRLISIITDSTSEL